MVENFTINQVKQLLPMVKVKYNNEYYWARVTGRQCKFACVSPYQKIDNRKLITTIIGPCYEVAWETVTDCINHGRPILL